MKFIQRRIGKLEAVFVPLTQAPMMIILNAVDCVDCNGVTVSTREIIINLIPALPVKLGGRRR